MHALLNHSISVLLGLDRARRKPLVSDVVPTVFIVDDDVSVRESLEEMILNEGWHPVVFSTAEGFLSYPRAKVPSCLVLDVNLPELNGLDVQALLSADRLAMPIIFITGYGDIPMSVKAMRAGAFEFLEKPFSDEVLLSVIRHAIDESNVAVSADFEVLDLERKYTAMSPREQEVMALVVSGMMNKQIGAKLGISEITVKSHRGRVMRKMNAESLASLIGMSARLATDPAR
jgi:FixJ family two-component response regulator